MDRAVAVVTPETELDRDRVASMADEGGVAAAEVEAQVPAAGRRTSRRRSGPGIVGVMAIGILAGAALALALGSRRRADRADPGKGDGRDA